LRPGNAKIGTWLGQNNGNNNLSQVETYYYSDHTTKFLPAVSVNSNICPTCPTDLNIVGFGWYQLNCILHAESQLSTFNATTNTRLNCGNVGGVIGNVENDVELNNYAIFPNPTTGELTLKGNLKGQLVQVFNTQGQLIKSQIMDEIYDINIGIFSPGIYFVKVPVLNLSWKVILTN